MTEHDQRSCLRCGKAAGEHRFCEPCHSQFASLLEPPAPAVAAVAEATGSVASSAGAGWSGPTMAAGPGDRDVHPAESQPGSLRPAAFDPDRRSAGRGERLNPPIEVARFESVLTPDEVDEELEAHRRADAAGDAQAATNVGVLFERKGDLDAALAAYRRAERRGDVNGAFNLGCLLAEMGDQAGAKAALQRADEHGDGAAASNLGVLLEGEGDLDGALAAYRRADERGDAAGAFNLGLLLVDGGELAGARAAYRRAIERGDSEMRERAVQAEAEIRVPAPEIAPSVNRSRKRWMIALCLLALVVVVLARRR